MIPERRPRALTNSVRTVLVTNAEQQAHAFAVRAICFLEERGLPYSDDFDGNDYDASHIVVYQGDEPIGAARLRWFNGFVKWERTCFRPKFRDLKIIRKFEQDVVDHIARRGIPLILTYAQEPYASLWTRMFRYERTGRVIEKADGGRTLIELRKAVPPVPDAITPDSDPVLLHRLAGSWDMPAAYG